MENVTQYEIYDSEVTDYELEEPCNLNPGGALTQTIIYSIISVFGLIGNILVMVTYVFYKRAKTMTDVYLFNVAVADLIFVLALPLIMYNEHNHWPMGNVACKMLGSAYSINLYSGMLLLACISCDRYVAIVQARRSFGSRAHALTYSRLICSAVWLFAVALTLPTLIYTELLEEEDRMTETQMVTCQLNFHTEDTAKLMKVMVPSLQMAIGFLLPLFVMVFCYSCIVYTLLRAQSSQRHKAIRVILAVVVVFVACHLPYNMTLLIHTMFLFKLRDCEEELIKLQVLAISRSVAFLHCSLNPILYAFIGVKFRKHFLQIISDLWCIGKKFIYPSRSSRGTPEVCTMRSSEGSNNISSFSA
ncbi:C-C chemokine receptor type 6 [Melanotaenia boesemani]|uniref:C-C chemokine receptor type 6 n=1 Tax=Melanotaenia boesemani TaxID=1250792 RepID=UPI001C0439B8|nr:C-C chemokine receptor type 6 [Melanotaenia boesemani]